MALNSHQQQSADPFDRLIKLEQKTIRFETDIEYMCANFSEMKRSMEKTETEINGLCKKVDRLCFILEKQANKRHRLIYPTCVGLIVAISAFLLSFHVM